MAVTQVANFAELKTAIESDTINEIVVTNDIVFSSGGAKVNSKPTLTIDFGGHTVTDNNTSSTDTIYVASSTNTIFVNEKNAVWSGRNYYGVVGVYDGNINTTVSMKNICQMAQQHLFG